MNFVYEEKQRKKNYTIQFFLNLIGGLIGTLIIMMFSNIFANRNIKFEEAKVELTSDDETKNKKIFIETENESSDDNWLEEDVFQKEVRGELKIWLNNLKFLSHFRKEGELSVNKHILFHGPPGTGKSYLARLLGEKESLAYGFFRFGGDIYVGTSKIKMNIVFREAKRILEEEAKKPKNKSVNKPVLIIVDEIDSVGIKTFSPYDSSNESTNGLLTLIDDIEREKLNIIIIGITNYSDMLESSLVRPGRLGNKIEFNHPSKEELAKSVENLKKTIFEKYKTYEEGKENKGIFWAEDFWEKVKEVVFVERERKKFNLINMEAAMENFLAKKCGQGINELKIGILDIGSYKEELEKLNQKDDVKNDGTSQEVRVTPKVIREIFENLFKSKPEENCKIPVPVSV